VKTTKLDYWLCFSKVK